MNFFDRVWIVNNQRRRDEHQRQMAQEEELFKVKHKFMTEISDNTTQIGKLIQKQIELQRSSSVPLALYKGIEMISLYAMYMAGIHQPAPLSTEQKELLELYFKNLSFSFSINDFILALRNNNSARNILLNNVGISSNKCGDFWKEFFALLYRTDSDGKIIEDLYMKISDITLRFGVLGNADKDAIANELHNFHMALLFWANECRTLPKSRIDEYGDESYVHHYQQFKKAYYEVSKYANSIADDLDPDFEDSIFEALIRGTIYRIVNSCNRDKQIKAKMIERVIEDCNISFIPSGNNLIDTIEDSYNEDGQLSMIITNPNDSQSHAWSIITVMAGAYNENTGDVLLCLDELSNFIIGMEEMLNKSFPMSGFSKYSKVYTNECMKIVSKYIDNH